jgi:hypothetical protein
MRHPDRVFSVHVRQDGSFALYLEEQDANLDMFEDILEQVSITDLSLLKEQSEMGNLRSVENASKLDSVRKNFPEVATRIAYLDEAEALSLAEILIDAVKVNRAFGNNPKPVKLELVK